MNLCRPAVWLAAPLLALVGCSHSARPASPQPATTQTIPRAPVPRGSAQPPVPAAAATSTAPVVTPSSGPSAAAKPLPSRLPPAPKKVLRLSPNAAPQILNVAVSETTVHPGDQVFGRVVTTSNVASVEARIGGYAMSLVKVGVGKFELTYTVAPLPWFIRGNFTMQVIARNTRGDAVTRAIPLTVR